MYVEFAYYGLMKSRVDHMAIVYGLFVIHFIWRRGSKRASLFGRVDALDDNTETWENYTERLGHGIGDESGGDKAKRRAILLSVCGSKVYKMMCGLLAPAKP